MVIGKWAIEEKTPATAKRSGSSLCNGAIDQSMEITHGLLEVPKLGRFLGDYETY